jgi:branched-chain amino acid transport system permease protein
VDVRPREDASVEPGLRAELEDGVDGGVEPVAAPRPSTPAASVRPSESGWGAPQWITLGIGALLAILYPIPSQVQDQTYFQTVGFLVLINAMLGVGWNIIGGWAGQFDFGPQIFFAIGAYTAGVLLDKAGVNAWVAIVAAVLVTVVICALITYPITKLRGHYFAIATVAMWMIAQPIGSTWDFINGSLGLFIPFRSRDSGLEQALALQFTGKTKEMGYYYAVLFLFALTVAFAYWVKSSKLGYSFMAVRDDQDGAEAIGINSRVMKVVARCMTAGVFAVGGVIYSMWALSIYPEQVLDLQWGTLPTIAAVVGGLGRIWGPLLGALVLIPLSQWMSTTLGTGPLAGRGIDLVVYGLIIMLIAALRPQGLLSLPWSRWYGLLTGRKR